MSYKAVFFGFSAGSLIAAGFIGGSAEIPEAIGNCIFAGLALFAHWALN